MEAAKPSSAASSLTSNLLAVHAQLLNTVFRFEATWAETARKCPSQIVSLQEQSV